MERIAASVGQPRPGRAIASAFPRHVNLRLVNSARDVFGAMLIRCGLHRAEADAIAAQICKTCNECTVENVQVCVQNIPRLHPLLKWLTYTHLHNSFAKHNSCTTYCHLKRDMPPTASTWKVFAGTSLPETSLSKSTQVLMSAVVSLLATRSRYHI